MVKKFVTFENILKGEVIMKKFLIGIMLFCSIAIQAADKKEQRKRSQSAGPLLSPAPVSPSGVSPAAALQGLPHQRNSPATPAQLSPAMVWVTHQAMQAEERRIQQLPKSPKPYDYLRPNIFRNKRRSPVVTPERPASVGAIGGRLSSAVVTRQRPASAGIESQGIIVEEFLGKFKFKKPLIGKKEYIEKSPTEDDLKDLAEALFVDIDKRYQVGLNGIPFDYKKYIQSLNKQLFNDSRYTNKTEEIQKRLRTQWRYVTDGAEKRVQNTGVLSPKQLQLATNRERIFGFDDEEEGSQTGFFSPPMMGALPPTFYVEDEYGKFEPIRPDAFEERPKTPPAVFSRAARAESPAVTTGPVRGLLSNQDLTGRRYGGADKSSGLPPKRLFGFPVGLPGFEEESDNSSEELEPDYSVPTDNFLPVNPVNNDNDDYQGEEDEPNLADFMKQNAQDSEEDPEA